MLFEWLRHEEDPSIRQALVLVLGLYQDDSLSADRLANRSRPSCSAATAKTPIPASTPHWNWAASPMVARPGGGRG